MPEFTLELETAARLAREAGTVIMQVYETEFAVDYKGVADPVTEADKRANDLIVNGLKQQFPDDTIVAEESPPPEKTLLNGRVWYVDPLDGTKEFIAKNGEFSVMIGLAINGQARLGIVYQPAKKKLYGGITDQEAWTESNGSRTPLKTESNANLQDLRLVVSRSHRNPFIDTIREKTGLHQEVRSGSVGLKIGLIASTMADVYIEPAPYTSVWDACAPEAIIRGAGGRFSDIKGDAITYGHLNLKNTRGLVASNGACHDSIIHAIAPFVDQFMNR